MSRGVVTLMFNLPYIFNSSKFFRYSNLILNLFSLMVDANIPDIALEPDKTVKKVSVLSQRGVSPSVTASLPFCWTRLPNIYDFMFKDLLWWPHFTVLCFRQTHQVQMYALFLLLLEVDLTTTNTTVYFFFSIIGVWYIEALQTGAE